MESYYEINVAFNGEHFCRIKLPEHTETEAGAKFEELRKVFEERSDPRYKCTLTYWNVTGKEIIL